MTTRLQEFKLSVAEILGHPGAARDLHLAAVLPEVHTTLARLAPAPLDADLRTESAVEGVLVTGRVRGTTVLECARCLAEFDSAIALDVCELFVAPGYEEPDEDAYRVQGTEIDLEPMLRDAVTLDLPLNPLCRQECAGLCARCGKDLNAGSCDCPDGEADPRWAPLAALRDRLQDH